MFALFLLMQAQPQAPPPADAPVQAQPHAADIIVSGKRLVEAQAQCAKGGCTPLRDAQASIALAETQFRVGQYVDAKRMLAAAISRNRDQAATAPRPVAALYEAYATVALHEGNQTDYRRAVANQVKTLRDNLPAGDVSVMSAATALGDMWIKLSRYREADGAYRTVEQDSLAAGQDRTAMLAGMKRMRLINAMGRQREALDKLAELEARPIAREAGFRTALKVLRLRVAARDADEGRITSLIAELGQEQGGDPLLIWSPPYEVGAMEAANADARQYGEPDPVQPGSGDLDGIRWVDVGFWIRPDGHTDEVEILRGARSNGWADPAIEQVEGRRYAASAATGGSSGGVYRVERVTKRTRYVVPKGSLISRRTGVGGFEIVDLTGQPIDPPT